MLSARSLELYGKPGAGAAARSISKAVTAAKAEMVRHLAGVPKGRSPVGGDGKLLPKVLSAYRVGYDLVWAELRKHSEFGATDSEPVHHCEHVLVKAIAEHLRLDTWDAESLAGKIL